MNIDINLMVTIVLGVVLGFLIKKLIVFGLSKLEDLTRITANKIFIAISKSKQ